ncbi:MAG: substrate-binding domain-containing protein [Gammaproteobacteria bacterium]|nr:substrate-binding domain-containing protein [Gammaproteobacteria bacterium]
MTNAVHNRRASAAGIHAPTPSSFGRGRAVDRWLRGAVLAGLSVFIVFAGRSPVVAAQVPSRLHSVTPYDAARAEALTGSLTLVGSESMAGAARAWARAFQDFHPKVEVSVVAGTAADGMAALNSGTAQIALMAREPTYPEIEPMEVAKGYRPTAVSVGVDAVTLFVPEANDLAGLNLRQLEALLAGEQRCESALPRPRSWAELGVQGPLAERPIVMLGLPAEYAASRLLGQRVLCAGAMPAPTRVLPDQAALVAQLRVTPEAIGFASRGAMVPGLRAVPLTVGRPGGFLLPTDGNILHGRYPLYQEQFLVVDKSPAAALAPVLREFMKMVLSVTGQRMVQQSGLVPLLPVMADKQRRRLELD